MISINDTHPDLEEFIDIKTDLNKVTKANISIRVSDEFMKAVKEDKDWELYFKREETGEEIKKTVKARDLFRKLAHNNWNYAEPGMLYWDRINTWNLLSEDNEFEFAGVNPCLVGDTLIQTVEGEIPIKELVGTQPYVYCMDEEGNLTIRQASKVWKTRENAELVKVVTGKGELICTPDHRIYTTNRGWIEAKDLKSEDVVKSLNKQTHDFNDSEVKEVVFLDYTADVYDMTVPEVHNFVANDIIVHNCAEEPLPAGGSCLLGSINLSAFVENPFTTYAYFNKEAFKDAVETAIRALNEVLLEGLPLHPLKIQQESVNDWRQMGLGVMGIADMLIKLGIRYGSLESLSVCDDIGFTLADTAIKTSALIAKEQGTYPKYKKEAVMKSKFFLENTTLDTKALVEKYGLAHSQLLTIAPTGSLSTMLGISGGIEPIFNLSYTRKTESLHGEDVYYKVFTPIVEEYMKINNITKEEDLPDYFVTAMTLNWKERVDMQSVWQKHIDASISSTVNLPEHTSVEEVEELYMYAWEKGLKGLTIYRDNCLRSGILINKDVKKSEESVGLQRGDWEELPEDLVYYKRKIYIGCGKLNLFIGYSPSQQRICDFYVVRSGNGGCEKNLQGMVIAMSGMLRLGGSLYNIEKAFEGLGACNSFISSRVKGQKLSQGSSCGTAILSEIKKFMSELGTNTIPSLVTPKSVDEPSVFSKEEEEFMKTHGEIAFLQRYGKCPVCGEKVHQQEGCFTCSNCGWTKCS